jgi:hypothetical protein
MLTKSMDSWIVASLRFTALQWTGHGCWCRAHRRWACGQFWGSRARCDYTSRERRSSGPHSGRQGAAEALTWAHGGAGGGGGGQSLLIVSGLKERRKIVGGRMNYGGAEAM